VQIIRAALEDWSAGDEPDLAFYDPDVEWIAARSGTEGAFHGHAGIRSFRADTTQTFDRFELDVEMLELADGRVLAWGKIHVRGRASGVEMDVPIGGIVELRGGRISRWEDFGSKERAERAASETAALPATAARSGCAARESRPRSS
jgi:ketosteroid isomerase-like protein